jgi:hypothetical protein
MKHAGSSPPLRSRQRRFGRQARDHRPAQPRALTEVRSSRMGHFAVARGEYPTGPVLHTAWVLDLER